MISKEHRQPNYIDSRGGITNLITVPINHIVSITSVVGAIRGNHYHLEDNHYVYLVSGRMIYYQCSKNIDIIEEVETLPGDLIFTPANTPHAMYFPEDSVFFAFTTRTRTNKMYEEDTIPYKLL